MDGSKRENLLKKFISKIYTTNAFSRHVNDPFGGVVTNSSGYLDTLSFMNATRDFLKTRFAYQETFFEVERLIIQKEKSVTKTLRRQKLFFVMARELMQTRTSVGFRLSR